jgi:hypothetical protein
MPKSKKRQRPDPRPPMKRWGFTNPSPHSRRTFIIYGRTKKEASTRLTVFFRERVMCSELVPLEWESFSPNATGRDAA